VEEGGKSSRTPKNRTITNITTSRVTNDGKKKGKKDSKWSSKEERVEPTEKKRLPAGQEWARNGGTVRNETVDKPRIS